MTPAELSRTVLATVRRAVAADELRVAVPERIVVQRPPRPGCGDYATNVALQLAGPAGLSAYEVAEILGRRLAKEPGIAQVEIAGPGFLNITLNALAYADVVRQVREQGEHYGRGDGLADDAVTVVAAPDAVRATMVAEVVNRLLDAAGARPGPPEVLAVAEPPAGALFGPGAGSAAESAAGSPVKAPAGAVAPEGVEWTAEAAAAPSAGSNGHAPVLTVLPGRAADPAVQATARGAQPPALPLDPSSGRTAPSALLGGDAYRWAMLRPPAEDVPAFAPGLLEQREANPLFRIRYAYARTRALLRNARDLGVRTDQAPPSVAAPPHPAPVAAPAYPATSPHPTPGAPSAYPASEAASAHPTPGAPPAHPTPDAPPANPATSPHPTPGVPSADPASEAASAYPASVAARANPATSAHPTPDAPPANPAPSAHPTPGAPSANPASSAHPTPGAPSAYPAPVAARANPTPDAAPANPAPSPHPTPGALPPHPTPGAPSPHPTPSALPPHPTPGAPDPYHHPAETELLGLIADFPRVVETAARRRAPDRLARHLERLADAFARFHDECPALPKGDEKPSAVHAARIRLADATGIVLADGLHLLGISAPDHL